MGRAVAKPINIIASYNGFYCVLPILQPKATVLGPANGTQSEPLQVPTAQQIEFNNRMILNNRELLYLPATPSKIIQFINKKGLEDIDTDVIA